MSELVRDTNGETFELRPVRAGSGVSALSLRDMVNRHSAVQGALDDPGNHDAFVRVLNEIDPLRSSITLSPEEARAMVLEALSSGELELVRHVWRHRPIADVLTAPPESLTDLAEEAGEEVVAATHTFEFELVDGSNNPVPSEPYRVELPDGQVVEGRLNGAGVAMITGIASAGNCTLSFPNRSLDEWAVA